MMISRILIIIFEVKGRNLTANVFNQETLAGRFAAAVEAAAVYFEFPGACPCKMNL